jgi:signal transduction histidine kinase
MFFRPHWRWVAYALALCMFLAVGAVFTFTSWNRAVERHERDLETRVVMGSHAVDAYLISIERSLADLGDRLRNDGFGPAGRLLLQRYQRNHPEFEIASVIGLDGSVVASSEAPIPNVAGQPFFIDAKERLLNGERMTVSRPFYGRTVPKWLIHLRYGVRDAGGQLQFMVGGGIDVARAQAFWKDVPLAPGADMGLLRDDLYAIARYPIPPAIGARVYSEPQPGLLSDYLRKHGFPAAGVVRGYSVALRSNATVAFRRMHDYPIYFVSVNPNKLLVDEWWASAWPTYAVLLALLLGGMAIVRWSGQQEVRLEREREARVAQLEDLTLRLRRSKDELENAKARLEHANAELEAYMYSVSHDLQAPVRAIDGYSAMLHDELAAPAGGEAGRLLGLIRASAARMGGLLGDLLNLSRYSMRELRRDDVDMRAEVETVIADLGSETSGARIEIGALPACRADRNLMRQVWSNLITNAIKYSGRARAPAIRIGYEDGAYFVADNGIGFDMAYADKLFKLFSRLHADAQYAGTGVGLAIVKRIVERHGGTVRAAGVPGAGARFFFTIPA